MTKNLRKIFYPTFFFIGLFLTYFQIEIYRNTFIDSIILIIITLISSFIAYSIDFKNFKKNYFHYKTVKLYAWMNYLIGIGLTTSSTFILLNYYFADKKLKTETYKIIDYSFIQSGGKNFMTREKKPVFIINYKDKKKELIFYSSFFNNMKTYKEIEIVTCDGLFGFEVIVEKKLKKD